jgi:hypothetical protein
MTNASLKMSRSTFNSGKIRILEVARPRYTLWAGHIGCLSAEFAASLTSKKSDSHE